MSEQYTEEFTGNVGETVNEGVEAVTEGVETVTETVDEAVGTVIDEVVEAAPEAPRSTFAQKVSDKAAELTAEEGPLGNLAEKIHVEEWKEKVAPAVEKVKEEADKLMDMAGDALADVPEKADKLVGEAKEMVSGAWTKLTSTLKH
ncbi:MAG: hypothetical protein ACOYEV_04510 [Candidatus Nanopelagicales bacterium]